MPLTRAFQISRSPPNHGHLPIPRSQSPDEVMGVLGLASNSRLPYPITRQSPSGTFGRLLEPSAPAHPSTGIVPETVVVSAPSPHRPFHSTVDASPAPTHSHNLNASLGETRRTEEGEEVLADEIMSGNPDSPAASTVSGHHYGFCGLDTNCSSFVRSALLPH